MISEITKIKCLRFLFHNIDTDNSGTACARVVQQLVGQLPWSTMRITVRIAGE